MEYPFKYIQNYLNEEESKLIFEELKNVDYQEDIIYVGKDRIERKEKRKTIWLSNNPNLIFEYSGKTMKSNLVPYYLEKILEKLENDFSIKFDGILVNYYQDGNTNMGYHSDPIENWDNNFIVISLGQTRKFIFRDKNEKNKKVEYIFKNGDLIYMFDNCQEKFEHSVRKVKEEGERFSLVFKKSKIMIS